MGRDFYPHFQMWKSRLKQGKVTCHNHWQVDNRVGIVEWYLDIHRPKETLVMLSKVCIVGSKPRQLACESSQGDRVPVGTGKAPGPGAPKGSFFCFLCSGQNTGW